MAQSTLSLLGLYNYNDTILDELALPEAMEPMRDTITGNILLESAEFEILFPDPGVLKTAIGFWSRKCVPVWEELYNSTQYEYNPIWNKDGTYRELETRDLAGSSSRTGSSSNTETRNLAGSSEDTGEGSETIENDVFGYNSSTAAHESKTTDTTEYSRTNETTQTGTVTDVGSSSDTGSTTDTGTISRERTEQGNIGITSTQELIQKQREVVEFNIMDRIVKDFIQRFCILVY